MVMFHSYVSHYQRVWNTELCLGNAPRSCFVSSWSGLPPVCESSWAIRMNIRRAFCRGEIACGRVKFSQIFVHASEALWLLIKLKATSDLDTSYYCFCCLWLCSCDAFHVVVTNSQTGFHLCLRSSEVTALRADFSVLVLVKLWSHDTGVPSGEPKAKSIKKQVIHVDSIRRRPHSSLPKMFEVSNILAVNAPLEVNSADCSQVEMCRFKGSPVKAQNLIASSIRFWSMRSPQIHPTSTVLWTWYEIYLNSLKHVQ